MKKILLLTFFSLTFALNLFAQGTWIQKSNFSGIARHFAASFSINNKGYVTTGRDVSNNLLNDTWEYEPITDSWTQKANFAGTARWGAMGTAILNKGYVSSGLDITSVKPNDLWEYDPILNSWQQKSFLPAGGRRFGTAFSIGNKGYFGTGEIASDFWEYTPSSNTWVQKATCPGGYRVEATSFSIGNFGYIGVGWNGNSMDDFYEYNPLTNVWTQKANYGGQEMEDCAGFSIGQYGYIGIGETNGIYTKELWMFEPLTNSWQQTVTFPGTQRDEESFFVINNCLYLCGDSFNIRLNDNWQSKELWMFEPLTNSWQQTVTFPGTQRDEESFFVINNCLYLCCGDSFNIRLNDNWQFCPSPNGIGNYDYYKYTISIFPNPTTGLLQLTLINDKRINISIFNTLGKCILEKQNIFCKELDIDISHQPNGIYIVVVNNGEKYYYKKIIVEHD